MSTPPFNRILLKLSGEIFAGEMGYGIDPKMKESLLMAVLAVARIQNLPANMPSVSGADRQTVMGNILRTEQDQYLTREKN